MNDEITTLDLIEFEQDIADEFNNGNIHAPVHLYSNNEHQIIEIFKKFDINENDWVFCTWRSHYQCLLKGVPSKILKKEIMEGRSISLNFPEYKVYSSAIVGGAIPIALGVALSLVGKKGRVFCFLGDMAAESGIFSESLKYSINMGLPIRFIIEDNELSVCTDTNIVWGKSKIKTEYPSDYVTYYKYKNKWPHAGAGKRVQF